MTPLAVNSVRLSTSWSCATDSNTSRAVSWSSNAIADSTCLETKRPYVTAFDSNAARIDVSWCVCRYQARTEATVPTSTKISPTNFCWIEIPRFLRSGAARRGLRDGVVGGGSSETRGGLGLTEGDLVR